jgi:hypothetical protein
MVVVTKVWGHNRVTIVDPKRPDGYENALRILHKKDGDCLKCGKFITEQTLHGSLCQKCVEDFARFEEQEDEKYMAKNPDRTILDPKLFVTIFRKFVGLDKETFVMS